MAISAAFPFESHSVDVAGVRMHYVEQGKGDPVLFLHGNLESSYIWRNIIPIVSARGRCIAPDLVGFGKSDKPDIGYTYFDHVRYVDGFIKALNLTNLTLVVHDWGGAFGFDYALRHRDNIKAIAFWESVVFTVTWEAGRNQFHKNFQDTFKKFRTPKLGWKMICEENAFIEQVLPGGIVRKLSQEEHDAYRRPFPTAESRKPVWAMPNMIPFDDRQDDTWRAVKNIEQGLSTLTMPTLLFWAHPGILVNNEEQIRWFQQQMPALTVIDLGQGIHFLQEDHPDEIGHGIVQ